MKQKELNNPYENREPGTTPPLLGFRATQKTTLLPPHEAQAFFSGP